MFKATEKNGVWVVTGGTGQTIICSVSTWMEDPKQIACALATLLNKNKDLIINFNV